MDFHHVRLSRVISYTQFFSFAAVCNTCSYASRTIRLLVLYSLKARKAAPWLLSERNHVIFCLLLGAASTTVPLHNVGKFDDGPLAASEYMALGRKQFWIVTFCCQGVVLLLNPIAWFVDDIFGVGPELRVMMVVQLITSVAGRIAEGYASPDLFRWLDSQNFSFFSCVIMLSVSIIAPIKRRLAHPMQSSDPNVVKLLARRRALGALRGTSVGPLASGHGASDEDGSFFSSSISSGTQPNAANSSTGTWTYEKVMKTPEVSAAFEAFSQKALCQESFLFLRDATTFQAQSFGDVEANFADDSKTNGEGGSGVNAEGKSESGQDGKKRQESEEQYLFFSKIVREYIVDGAPNEINISGKDRTNILDVYHNKRRGELGFRDLPASERRLVFARAYAEVRFMLETNLMLKFVSTADFEKALTAARANASKESTL